VRRLAFLFLFIVALGAGVVVPAAAAEPLRANVVSVSPNDIDQPDVPVSIVFRLYKPELPSPQPDWGKPVGGVNDVEVLVHGQGQTRRFPTEDLGGGRYRTEIVFPEPGGWTVRVSYAAGSYDAGDEIDLGKGAICIAADCVGPQPDETAPADSNGQPWTKIIVVVVVVAAAAALALALVAVALVRFGAIGRRRRMAPIA
jgi:hypothetical protein